MTGPRVVRTFHDREARRNRTKKSIWRENITRGLARWGPASKNWWSHHAHHAARCLLFLMAELLGRWNKFTSQLEKKYVINRCCVRDSIATVFLHILPDSTVWLSGSRFVYPSYTVRWSNFERQDPKIGVFLQSTDATPCGYNLKWKLTPENPLRTPCSWQPWPWFSREKSLKIFKLL